MQEENKKSEQATREEKILEFWKENKVFEKSLTKDAPKGNYVFYDGPPFATGVPHYGHILGSTVKDVVGRYQTMQGFRVPRRWGWDCHGLPIENIVEKDLKISGRKEIEAYGIKNFSEYARSKVLTYVHEWKKTVDRMGRWVDFDNSYKTMDNSFIESVWWALGELHKKELLYEGVRVLAYCPRCETPIANSEIAMDNSYKDITDISVYVKFPLEGEEKTSVLAWTTTPWSLPGDTALAINKNIKYVKVELNGEFYILAQDRLKFVPTLKDIEWQDGVNMWSIGVNDLLGKKYSPPFNYYLNADLPHKENAWKIYHADFVTTDAGTGVAHEAPAFGEDDMVLAKANNIPFIRHVEPNGTFSKEVTEFAGIKVKPKEDHQSGDVLMIKYLAGKGLLFAKEKMIHSYPHCYRCDTPLLYYALPSWFINIQNVKADLVKHAKEMNWIPEHLKEGRFHNILENAPDWTISRNRFWASPLPIWKSESGKVMFVSSLEDLKNKTHKKHNRYFVMRHGEGEHNVKNIYSSDRNANHLTEAGRAQVASTAKELEGKKITKIYASPFLRTRETAEIVAEHIGYPKDQIIFDDRIRELEFGDFSERPMQEYWDFMQGKTWDFDTVVPGGESFSDGKKRFGDFLYDINEQNEKENILIVSHGLAIELVPAIIEGADKVRSLEIFNNKASNKTASLHKEHEFVTLPHNDNYELDLHRPYIDSIVLIDEKGDKYHRIPEVIDCWFESGSMPFAQDHYPFKNPDWQKNNFPAGFVAEYIAQTRTWFYYSHVISSVLFGQAPFQNIVTTGTVLAEDGSKMSKSKNNFPDPWILFDKYGVDALRFYLMAGPLMKGEDVNFSERSVQEVSSKIIGRLFNVLTFYELYRDMSVEKDGEVKSGNVLDQWIVSRFSEVESAVTVGMTKYDINEALKPVDLFIEDLSTWYLRRSRERIKDGDGDAKATLYFVLKNLAKIMAPFTPFTSEEVWQRLKTSTDVESVHLAGWPKAGKVDAEILQNMQIIRETVSELLKERQKANIPVRQALSSATGPAGPSEYLEIIKEELNVKEYKATGVISLDTEITEDLKQEGLYRELVRALQDMRKAMGLVPSDVVSVSFDTSVEGKDLVEKFSKDMKKVVTVSDIKFETNGGEEVKVGELVFKVEIKK